jgi:hypothetical protein
MSPVICTIEVWFGIQKSSRTYLLYFIFNVMFEQIGMCRKPFDS